MKAAPFLLVATLLASCVPTMTGKDQFNPQVMPTVLTPANLKPGETRFFQYSQPVSQWAIDKSRPRGGGVDFNNVIGSSVQSTAVAVEWLRMGVENLPDGVKVSLASATITNNVQRTEDSDNVRTVYYIPTIRYVLKIEVSPNYAGNPNPVLKFWDGSRPNEIIKVQPLFIDVAR